ncbi:CDP-alcohol phosphatidyltransferase family protein [Actinoplanes sp. NEAU-A12]|uniref:CDP-alcohol phosphatidyltransferase family protein n=1 Tax=Actinoplanes sandaracinus TaxID=3045177 RepID=A0ABT6WUJ6_9ACTN|nr:CDP-alcohol phosphatidyltransferase family protein [Actinoplanes sandaracinus]MDI6103420.1 CDP-alcohol phosphatidyltransferase family protein [Actinoplanes sandaracinus]
MTTGIPSLQQPAPETGPLAIDSRSDVFQLNVPNVITLVRTAASVALAAAGLAQGSMWLIVTAYACYWIGDVLDGLTARLLGQETRFGAVFDIICDRACFSLAAAGLLVLQPESVLAGAILLFQFLTLDTMLSLSFLRWPILSPNYFEVVHRGVYRWNWWPPAKVLNTTSLVVVIVAADYPWIGAVLALGITVIKVVSLRVVSRLPAPGIPGPR